jgi:hypothetical protein
MSCWWCRPTDTPPRHLLKLNDELTRKQSTGRIKTLLNIMVLCNDCTKKNRCVHCEHKPSVSWSADQLAKVCDVKGPRGQTPAGNRCSTSFSCNQAKKEHNVNGWTRVSEGCMNPRQHQPKKRTEHKTTPTVKYDTGNRCDPNGIRYETPRGRQCTHSASCSRVRVMDGKDKTRSGPPGWNLIHPNCLGPEKPTTPKRTGTTAKKEKTTRSVLKNSDRQPTFDATLYVVGDEREGPYGDAYKVARRKSANSKKPGRLYWQKA